MQPSWQTYLPFVVIGLLVVVRLRRAGKARRMHLGRLAVGPTILGVLAIYLFASIPPDLTGAAIFAGSAALGAALGWQRARLTKIVYDAANDTFTMQQSPLAVALLVGVMLLRRLLLPSMAMQGGGLHTPGAMWVIDGIIGFGLGMIASHNLELFLRARTLRAGTISDTFS